MEKKVKECAAAEEKYLYEGKTVCCYTTREEQAIATGDKEDELRLAAKISSAVQKRTTAVFFIKYLRTLGFTVTNDIFAENAWYFRNALVRANYTNLQKGIHETTEYLEVFLRSLLLNEKNELHNRNLHISRNSGEEKMNIAKRKVDIEGEKVDIEGEKVDIEILMSGKENDFSAKTKVHIYRLFDKFGFDEIFGRSALMTLLGLKKSSASKLISRLIQTDIIEPVSGHGKGKYRFRK